MRLALELAEQAAQDGEVPVGCVVLAPDGAVLATGANRRERDRDPTAHAEVVALRAAAVAQGKWRLEDCTVYVTLEPCLMCAGALSLARVRKVVFGARDPKAGAVISLYAALSDPRLNHRAEVEEGLLVGECRSQLQSFFEARRAGPPKG